MNPSPALPTSTATGNGMSTSGNFPTTPHVSSPSATTPANADAYENICGICFTEVHPIDNPRGRLNSCDHLFCAYCIKEWAKNTNVCPSCKARFTRIYTVNADTQQEEETKVRRKNYKAWELTYYSDDEDEEEWEDDRLERSSSQEQVVCEICHQSHNAARMIFCDRRQCTYAAHLDCLGMAERPVTFLCPACTELREKESEGGGSPASIATTTHATSTAGTTTASATRVRAAAPAVPVRPRAVNIAATAPAAPTRRSANRQGSGPAPLSTSAPSLRTAAPMQTRALYGGSRSNSTTSSSGDSDSDSGVSSPAPSTTRTNSSSQSSSTVAAPRAPVDFSKPHLHLLPPAPSSSPPSRRSRAVQPATTGPNTDPVDEDGGDDYYFLSPTSHAVAATIDLERTKASRAAEAQTRRQRERAKAERLEAAYGVRRATLPVPGSRKRPQQTPAEEFSAELDAAEKEFADPQLRRVMEERMVRKWAADILPVLRRRRYIDGDTTTTEADMWTQATTQARKMVQEKLDARGATLRRRREQLVRAQATREAAALAKLARIIAQHRERDQQKALRAQPQQNVS